MRPAPRADRAGPRPHSDPFPLVASPDLHRWQRERDGGTVPRYIAQPRAAQDHRGHLVEETLRSLNGLASTRAGGGLRMGSLGTSEKLTLLPELSPPPGEAPRCGVRSVP